MGIKTTWQDERDNYSTPRILLWMWTVLLFYEVLFHFHELATSNPLLAFFSGVYLYLAAWSAGSKMASYLAPTIAGIVSGIGQARLVDPGTSSDVSEIIDKKKKSLNKG